jgi:hypothetical protein
VERFDRARVLEQRIPSGSHPQDPRHGSLSGQCLLARLCNSKVWRSGRIVNSVAAPGKKPGVSMLGSREVVQAGSSHYPTGIGCGNGQAASQRVRRLSRFAIEVNRHPVGKAHADGSTKHEQDHERQKGGAET